MIVGVCGGRIGVHPFQVWSVLQQLRLGPMAQIECLVDGHASGVDSYANAWAVASGLAQQRFKIDAALDGGRDDAPKRRNARMLDQSGASIWIGFAGGPGTRDMMLRAQHAGAAVWDVEIDRPDQSRSSPFRVYVWPLRPMSTTTIILDGAT